MSKLRLNIKRLLFLIGTVIYYHFNKRGISGDGYSYVAGCAIGRHLSQDLLNIIPNHQVFKETVFPKLPQNMRVLGKSFLAHIQAIHDDGSCWTKNKLFKHERLSRIGWVRVKELFINIIRGKSLALISY